MGLLSKFLPSLATVLAPLYERTPALAGSGTIFKASKKLWLSLQLLVHFNPDLEIGLACDASDDGIGAVLFHIMGDGTEKLVGFVSRTLSVGAQVFSYWERSSSLCGVGVTRIHSFLWASFYPTNWPQPLLSSHKSHSTLGQDISFLWVHNYLETIRTTLQCGCAQSLTIGRTSSTHYYSHRSRFDGRRAQGGTTDCSTDSYQDTTGPSDGQSSWPYPEDGQTR